MNVHETNTVFLTVATWPDWPEKIEIFLRSAIKRSIPLKLLDTDETWRGYYHHKIVRMRNFLQRLGETSPDIRYVVFSDCRDAVYVKSKTDILELLQDADDEKVLFALDNKCTTWPMTKQWLAQRITLKYGYDGVVNSGCYAGRIDRIISLLDECIRIHENLVSGNVVTPSIEAMLYNDLKPEYLNSDQFHIHAVQALWSDLIAVDVRRRVFACFRDGFPKIKTAPELGSNGPMPIGTAGILHSPWLLHRQDQSKETAEAWRRWAFEEGIVDENF